MIPPGRSQGEYRRAQDEGAPVNARLPIPTTWTTGSTASIKTGTWRAALAQHISAPSPCHAACPMHGEIVIWIG